MLAAIVAVLPMAAKDKYTTDVTTLPATAQTMLKTNFPKVGINHIKVDSHFLGSDEYDVVLNNGTEIEFDAKGNWKEVDCGQGNVPSSLIPKAITSYVDKNYKGSTIVKINRKSAKFEVELQSGVELEFDNNGQFLRID